MSSMKGKHTRLPNAELVALAREGLTPAEIAEAFGIQESHVRTRLSRAGVGIDGEPLDLVPSPPKRQRVVHFNASREDWQQDAACLGHDPEMWFWDTETERMLKESYAKRVCVSCPVRARCLEDALAAESPARRPNGALVADARYGIRGGLNPEQRARLAQGGAA